MLKTAGDLAAAQPPDGADPYMLRIVTELLQVLYAFFFTHTLRVD